MANFFAMPISKYHDADRLRALGPQSDQWVPIVGAILVCAIGLAGVWQQRHWMERDWLPRKAGLEALLKELDAL